MNTATQTSQQLITSEVQLRRIIQSYPKILDKRIQPSLDRYSREIIEHSRIAVIGINQESFKAIPLTIDRFTITDNNTLTIQFPNELDCSALTNLPNSQKNNLHASLYFLVPGIGHSLRINGLLGSILSSNDSTRNIETNAKTSVTFNIKQVYLHCARAAARSGLWQSQSESSQRQLMSANNVDSLKLFTKRSSYLLLKTMNQRGATEMSPRGDQPGFVQWLDDNTLFIPERPGNKVAISLQNILENPVVELLMFIPNCSDLLRVSARARITNEPKLLEQSIVNKKCPNVGILLEQCHFTPYTSLELDESELWLDKHTVDADQLTRFPKALSAHMNGEGLMAKAATPIIGAIVKNDMRHLY